MTDSGGDEFLVQVWFEQWLFIMDQRVVGMVSWVWVWRVKGEERKGEEREVGG